ncbi:MAG: M3 family oligoendopeptidase [Chitinophagaceae bacterium]|nr:M3 family oligoendopeptidase [Chitinophagaceae bacterium]
MTTFPDIQKMKRNYLKEGFTAKNWEDVAPFYKELAEREINSVDELLQWLKDTSELDSVLSEEASWRMIRMNANTASEEARNDFVHFMSQVMPQIQQYTFQLNEKLLNNPFCKELDKEVYFTFLRSIQKQADLFCKENLPLKSDLQVLQQQYAAITGKMAVHIGDREYTLQQAAKFLEHPQREIREDAYHKMNRRRLEDKETLNQLYAAMIQKRHQIARNAGFQNYRDFRFKELGRFDYTPRECYAFHQAIKKHILPLADKIYENRKQRLGLDTLRPWDLHAVPQGYTPLQPFRNSNELVQKTIHCLNEIHPFFGYCLQTIYNRRHLDIENRMHKAPTGFNCHLPETGLPFIFLNVTGTLDDMINLMHESGHAVHSILIHPLPLFGFKEYPVEFGEVASMSMELFSMNHWEIFFENEEERNRAKKYLLEKIIMQLPWIAAIDLFQHRIYEKPVTNTHEIETIWTETIKEFTSAQIDYSGLEEYQQYSWQKQIHVFEFPFYFIEYGIAQLGAIGLWQQYMNDKEATLNRYICALSKGGTLPLPELFNTAGLPFDFSAEYMVKLVDFLWMEWQKLN